MTLVEILLVSAVVILLVVDYLAYNFVRGLLIAHNSLLLYHHHFLQSKHKDYGQPED